MIYFIIISITLFSVYYLIRPMYIGIIFNITWIYAFSILRTTINNVSPLTERILYTSVILFNIAFMIGQNDIVIKNNKKDYFITNNINKQELNHFLINILLYTSFVLLLYYSFKVVSLYGFNLRSIRAADKANFNIFTSIVDTFLFYGFAGSISNLMPILFVYCFINKIRVYKREWTLMLINCVLYIITDAGRMLIVRLALFALAGLIWSVKNKSNFRTLSTKQAVVIMLGIAVALNITTSSRNSGEITFMQQLNNYFGGSLMHMAYQLDQESTNRQMYFGGVAYGGFFYYAIKILNVFGFHFMTSNDILFFLQSYKTLHFGNSYLYYNALVPNAYYYYFDSGMPGVVIFSLLSGFLSAKAENKYKKPSFMSFVYFSMLIYAAVFSPIGGISWNFRMPTVVIFAFLLRKRLFSNNNSGITGGEV